MPIQHYTPLDTNLIGGIFSCLFVQMFVLPTPKTKWTLHIFLYVWVRACVTRVNEKWCYHTCEYEYKMYTHTHHSAPANVTTGMTVCEHWATMTPQSNGKLFTSTLIDFYLLTVFLSLRLETTAHHLQRCPLPNHSPAMCASLSVSSVSLLHSNRCVFTGHNIETRARAREIRGECGRGRSDHFCGFCFRMFYQSGSYTDMRINRTMKNEVVK